ncbi:hypothetical protein C8R45DRAFT_1090108 [Mycena sanguinolenta]|nr:hypothetical protein C8R45DRAFT_1090108 [Mycena sanguinolenta]
MLPAQRNKIDIKKLSDQEQLLFAKYGKLPTHKKRPHEDAEAGVEPQNTVGTAIPNPENIPHASSPANGHAPLSISPTNPTSPVNKESGLAHDTETLNDTLDDHPMSAES